MIKQKMKIKVKKLDYLLKKIQLKDIDFVKIDTEGHEFEVLKGSKKFLKKFKIILIEFRRDKVYQNYHSSKIHRFILKNNFFLTKVFKFPFTSWEDRIYIQR